MHLRRFERVPETLGSNPAGLGATVARALDAAAWLAAHDDVALDVRAGEPRVGRPRDEAVQLLVVRGLGGTVHDGLGLFVIAHVADATPPRMGVRPVARASTRATRQHRGSCPPVNGVANGTVTVTGDGFDGGRDGGVAVVARDVVDDQVAGHRVERGAAVRAGEQRPRGDDPDGDDRVAGDQH
ncbi:hypothetical protein IAE22_28740, partial [Bacillus sp. S34]|nr:hypothetical protein [Bacillus sp. S34]